MGDKRVGGLATVLATDLTGGGDNEHIKVLMEEHQATDDPARKNVIGRRIAEEARDISMFLLDERAGRFRRRHDSRE